MLCPWLVRSPDVVAVLGVSSLLLWALSPQSTSPPLGALGATLPCQLSQSQLGSLASSVSKVGKGFLTLVHTVLIMPTLQVTVFKCSVTRSRGGDGGTGATPSERAGPVWRWARTSVLSSPCPPSLNGLGQLAFLPCVCCMPSRDHSSHVHTSILTLALVDSCCRAVC